MSEAIPFRVLARHYHGRTQVVLYASGDARPEDYQPAEIARQLAEVIDHLALGARHVDAELTLCGNWREGDDG